MPVQIRLVPFAIVSADVEAVKSVQGSSNPSSRSQRFNTAHHHLNEILPVVAEHPHFKHEAPSWKPFGYAIWHPLITESQHIQNEDTVIARIPSFMWKDLMLCHSAWTTTNCISQARLDEFIELWTSTKSGEEVAKYLDGKRKWFIRLDQMSPKDSPLGGKLPSTTVQEVIEKICSSMRAYGCLQRESEDARKENREVKIELVLNKWDDTMDTSREYRVFVPPPLAKLPGRAPGSVGSQNMKISAISQYRWHSPYVPPYPDTGLEETAQNIEKAAKEILQQILDFMNTDISNEVRTMLIRYGFTFDIIIKEGGEAQLVEINPFGALSGCGVCLFNGIIDGKVLYGLEGDDIEFAVTA
jgi:hypothetical protein